MTTRPRTAAKSRFGGAIRAVVEKIGRALESLQPVPRYQPVPVRVRRSPEMRR